MNTALRDRRQRLTAQWRHFLSASCRLRRWVGLMSPETGARYLHAVRLLQLRSRDSILDVGSGLHGGRPYTRATVLLTDQDVVGAAPPGFSASALALPLRSRAVPNVVCMDVLEHVGNASRQNLISELVRVANRTIVLGAPTGVAASRQDAELAEMYRRYRGERLAFFDEHAQYGLPDTDDIKAMLVVALAERAASARVEVHPDMNVAVRRLFMQAWIRQSFPDKVLWVIGLTVLPLVSRMNRGTCYRSIIVVRFPE